MFDIRVHPDDFQVTEDEIMADLLYPAEPSERQREVEALEALLRLPSPHER